MPKLAKLPRALSGATGAFAGVLLVAFVGLGGWIYYNTNVLNEYLPSDVLLDRQANYEKRYRQYQDLPQPRIVDVRADVDIFPEERRVQIRGHYRLVNKHDAPISELHVSMSPRAQLKITAPSDAPSALRMAISFPFSVTMRRRVQTMQKLATAIAMERMMNVAIAQ